MEYTKGESSRAVVRLEDSNTGRLTLPYERHLMEGSFTHIIATFARRTIRTVPLRQDW